MATINPADINTALEAAYIPYAVVPRTDLADRIVCAAISGTYRAELYPVVYFSSGHTLDQIVEHCRDAAASL